MLAADPGRRRIGHGGDHAEWVNAIGGPPVRNFIAHIGRRRAAQAGSHADTATLGLLLRELDAGVGDSLGAGNQCQLADPIEHPQPGRREVAARVELYRGTDRGAQAFAARQVESPDAGTSRGDVPHQCVDRNAQRRDNAKPRNGNPVHELRSPV